MVQTPTNSSSKSENQNDLRVELDKLEARLADLKQQYEQYFTGLVPLPPDKLHTLVKQQIKQLLNAPFRSSEINYRLKTLKGRYQTFDGYFQRVLKQREEGTYQRDVFKADLRDRAAKEEQYAQTAAGTADRNMHALFDSYREALQKQSGTVPNLDFKEFKSSLAKRARELKEKHGIKKLTFKIVVKNGKVSVQAKGQ